MHKIDDPNTPPEQTISFDEFRTVDIRVGRVVDASMLEGARKPAIRMRIDFGDGVGVKNSSAQITQHYSPEDMIGRQVLAVVNFPPRQIGKFMSEALTLGVPDSNGDIFLISPDNSTPNGARLV